LSVINKALGELYLYFWGIKQIVLFGQFS